MTIEIVQVNEGNAGLLDNLDEDLFNGKINSERLVSYLHERSHVMLLAINEGLVIGQVMAVVHKHPDKPAELYIDDLAVSERFQRRNIATQMVRRLFAIGMERGCEEIWVGAESNNTSAKKFYRSLGLSASTAYIFDGNLTR